MVRSFTAFLEKRNHAVVPTTTRFVIPTPLGRLANLPDRQAAIPRLHRRNPSYDAATVADATTATALISGGSALLGALVGGGVTIVAEVLRARGTRAERERDRRVAVDDLQRETLACAGPQQSLRPGRRYCRYFAGSATPDSQPAMARPTASGESSCRK